MVAQGSFNFPRFTVYSAQSDSCNFYIYAKYSRRFILYQQVWKGETDSVYNEEWKAQHVAWRPLEGPVLFLLHNQHDNGTIVIQQTYGPLAGRV
jgi:hypothetical protein